MIHFKEQNRRGHTGNSTLDRTRPPRAARPSSAQGPALTPSYGAPRGRGQGPAAQALLLPVISCELVVRNTTDLCRPLLAFPPLSSLTGRSPLPSSQNKFLRASSSSSLLGSGVLHHCVFFCIHKTLFKSGFS